MAKNSLANATLFWPGERIRSKGFARRGIPFLVLFLAFLFGGPAQAQDKLKDLGSAANQVRLDLANLLREYKAMGLTLPPKGAKFIHTTFNPSRIHHQQFAFEIEPRNQGRPPKLLLGLEIENLNYEYEEIKRPIDLRVVDRHCIDIKSLPESSSTLTSVADRELTLAIQCHAIGDYEAAEYFYKRWQELGIFTLKKRMAYLAWRHWNCELATANSDRAAIARHLKVLAAKNPDYVGEKTKLLIEGLEATLKPVKKKDGSSEQLLDQLVDYHCGNYYYWAHTFAEDMTSEIFDQVKKPDETAIKIPYRIIWQGFDAVPALFGRFDDKRLSRCRWATPEHLFFDGIAHIDNWARFLLYQWVCHPNQKRKWEGDGDDECFHSWWREVKQVGEEAYLLRNVLCDRPEENNIPYPPYLNLLFLKYPKRLPSLYSDVLTNKPKFHSKTLAAMVALGPFPKKDKLDWLIPGTQHSMPEHRTAAFVALAQVDQKQFGDVWLAAMEPNLKKEVIWDQSPFATGMGKLAAYSDDPRVWDRLDKVAQAAPLPDLARFLGDFDPVRTGTSQKHQVRFLAKFLDELAIWEVSDDVPLSKTISWGKEIEIRQLACLKLASLWGMVEYYQNFTPGEWQKFRELIHARAAKELKEK